MNPAKNYALVPPVIVGALLALLGNAAVAPTQAQTTANRRGVLIVSGTSGQSETYNARNRDVLVSGNDNRVQIRGTARTLRVNGDNNHVRVYTARVIRVGGSGNRVSYYRGPGGTAPRIYNVGGGNLITKVR